METPSRGSASSPDPLNESSDPVALSMLSSAARRITRSQRSNSMYSLDVRNKMQPSRFSSPRKQTFHLDVGSGISPQKIRVTVETEDHNNGSQANDELDYFGGSDEKSVNRLLFPAATPTPSLSPKAATARRRQRSSSPVKSSAAKGPARKKSKISTTTTKVPLRGLSDDEDTASTDILATPKPKRGRPRRSATPMPTGSTANKTQPATPAKASATPKRARKPRAATPKVEESSTLDELASVDATPALLSPVKRTPRATRRATPKSTTASRPAAKSSPKRTASSAFADSDAESVAESVTDSRPRKRGRGRPRRQAMAPDEMAAIVEQEQEHDEHAQQEVPLQEHEGQQEPHEQTQEYEEQNIIAGAASASPDPIVNDFSDAINNDQYQVPTPNSFTRMRAAVSPAPTSLSSVDLINVQTPARQNEENVAANLVEEEEQASEDFGYSAPAADDYFSDNDGGNYDVPDTFGDHEDSTPEDAMAFIPTDDGQEDLQIPRATSDAENAFPGQNDLPETEEPVTTEAPLQHEQDDFEDELAPSNPHSVTAENFNDAPVYSEELYAETAQADHEDVLQLPISSETVPMMEQPTLNNDSTEYSSAFMEENVAEANTASPAVDRVQDEAMATSSPKDYLPSRSPGSPGRQNIQRQPDDRILFSNVESPFVHELSASQNLREAQIAQSELTAADSDGEVDVVAMGGATDIEAESDAESDMGENATASLRDQDTIAKGEDFSMIGMESLQASINMSHAELPAMGETTSRIVSRTLESIRQASQNNDNQDNDGLSYLDFLYQSNPSTPVSAAQSPQTPKATPRVASSSPTHGRETAQRSSPMPPSVSPRKKAEPLGKIIARKSLQEAQASSATPRAVTAPELSDTAHPQPQAEQHQHNEGYDDSFSEIPDSVLEAIVPETTNTVYFSQQQADLTGRIAMPEHAPSDGGHGNAVEGIADEAEAASQSDHGGFDNSVSSVAESPMLLSHLSAKRQAHGAATVSASNAVESDGGDEEDDDQVAESQPDAEVTSSPPIHFAPHRPAPEKPTQQRHRLAQESRTTPVAFLSPRFPPAARHGGSDDHIDRLRIPSEGFRPSLSPIVRAGRALQSVTSDPPTPKENEGFLRSPFRSSVARDTQSPAAPQRREPSSPDPQPAGDQPAEVQLIYEQPAEAVPTITEPRDAQPATVYQDDFEGDDDELSDDEPDEELDEEPDEELDDEPVETVEMQQPPAVTPAQQPPSSASHTAWNMALAPFSGFKNLVVNGAQIISPRLRLSASASASPASQAPSTPARVTAAPAPTTQAAEAAKPSPQKRTAANARLDEQPSPGQAPHRAKRLRVDSSATRSARVTPSRPNETQPGFGSNTGRSWRSYIFRENSVAGSITSFASKLVSRTPNNENRHGAEPTAELQPEAETEPEPEVRVQNRLKETALPSEANATEYGSDAIMDMINDISGEGRDVEADAQSVQESDDADLEDADLEDIPLMTPAILPSHHQEPDSEDTESADEDVDIWAIEADRTTRVSARETEEEDISLPANPPPPTIAAPLRDPRIARIAASNSRKSVRNRNFGSSRLGLRLTAEDEGDEEYSLLDEDADELQGPVQTTNSPHQPDQFNLDDFFSSPIAVPRQLPPTSEKNIKFNEESRLLALGQYLEHERLRESRQKQQEAAVAALRRSTTVAAAPHWRQKDRGTTSTTTPAPPAKRPKPSYALIADPHLDEPSLVDSVAAASSPAHSVPVPALVPAPVPAPAPANKEAFDPSFYEALDPALFTQSSGKDTQAPRAAAQERKSPSNGGEADSTTGGSILEEDALESLPAKSSPVRSSRAINSRMTRINVAAPPQEAPGLAPSLSHSAARSPAVHRPVPNNHSTADSFKENQPISQARNPFGFSQKNYGQAREARTRSPFTAPLFAPLANQAEPVRESPEAATATAEQLNHRRLFDFAPNLRPARNVFFEDALEPQPAPSQSFVQGQLDEENYEENYEEEYEEETEEETEGEEEADELSRVEQDESSFLTPVLKPLPGKSASPTKSCIRPTTKPKTPGRVVEFTSSTMAADAGEEILAERENLENASLRFAEHFALDTDNRVPTALASHTQAGNAQPYNEDGDVHMMDAKEVALEKQRLETERGYEVDQVLSDIMLSDTHEISLPYAHTYPPQRHGAGRPYFFPAEQVVRYRWEAPPAIEKPPPRDWALDDWVVLNDVLQSYRVEGSLNFKLRYMPRRRKSSVKPSFDFETPLSERPSHALFNKVVHTQHSAMLVKDWHLDIVDVFGLRSGRIWNEHYLMRRLFSLLIGEKRRGVLGL